jgi:hypothetical protein
MTKRAKVLELRAATVLPMHGCPLTGSKGSFLCGVREIAEHVCGLRGKLCAR